ncbi:MAG: transposase domain-containing protein, partial [Planctomycetota bacterium]|nr:transposase domain-containing protein [Planctomycetota bacterium]
HAIGGQVPDWEFSAWGSPERGRTPTTLAPESTWPDRTLTWLFFGSPVGGQAAAILYTLTATCRRLKIDPCAYLKDVFERLPLLMQNSSAPDVPTLLMPLLPDRWLAEHPESQLQLRTAEAKTKSARRRSARTRRLKARNQAQQNRS